MRTDGVAFVTGGGGFAGRHLVRELEAAGCEVAAPAHAELDLLDGAATRAAVRSAAPERIFHLAARASVGRSWEEPAEAVSGNQVMTANLLEAARDDAPGARILIASSGEVYGEPESLPVDEGAPLRPRSPYAVSKVGSDLLGELYAEVHGLHVVRTRAFNHAGPGQSADYVVGSITRQVAEAERAGAARVAVRTGNPDAGRDFSDVRDVVRAYRLAIDAPPGVYNVASGDAVTVRELVAALADATELQVEHEVDEELVRPHDAPRVCGSAARLTEACGWRPEIPLEQTMRDAIADWHAKLVRS